MVVVVSVNAAIVYCDEDELPATDGKPPITRVSVLEEVGSAAIPVREIETAAELEIEIGNIVEKGVGVVVLEVLIVP